MDPIVPWNRPPQKLFRADETLAPIIGTEPIERPMIIQKLWKYIHAHKLQDNKGITADENLLKVFDGQKSVAMFDLVKFVERHIEETVDE
jgi:chromatin remodeling complex protein RSC6